MARILITPEDMDDASKKFSNAAQESRDLADQLNSLMDSLNSQWEGMTSQNFYERYETDKQNMITYVEMLEAVSTELTTIAQRFRDADQQ